MPKFIETNRGRKATVFTKAERDYYVYMQGRSEQSFLPSPEWVTRLFYWFDENGDLDPHYYYMLNPMDQDWWERNFATPEQSTPKPFFYEIFTNSAGLLTTNEVFQQIEVTGIKIDPQVAVRAYNTKLFQDEALYGEDLDEVELAGILSKEANERRKRVDDGVASMLGEKPIYFSFLADQVESRFAGVVEEMPHYTVENLGKQNAIGVAFPGEKALIHEVFVPGLGMNPDPGRDSIKHPGRKHWARITSMNGLDAFLFSPVLTLTYIQKEQAIRGQDILFEISPVLPRDLLAAPR